MKRKILLADMNSFFASCHQAASPDLKDEKVIVAGDPQKRSGIVLAASYPAKAKGVKTGMPLWEAKQLCPEGYYFKPDYQMYVDFSAAILRVMREITDLIEPFSIDEAFLDVTGVTRLWGPAEEIAGMLKERINSENGVMCSVGIGPNKLIAKMAAGVEKPDGLTVLNSRDDFKKVFWPRPVRDLFGVGPRYERHLKNFNVHTIGELADFPVDILKKRWGKNGEMLHYLANGIDNSPVVPGSLDEHKSIGNQKTLSKDYYGLENIKVPLLELCEEVGRRVRQEKYTGRTITLTLRDKWLQFFSASESISEYTDLTEEIYNVACRILHRRWNEERAVRLVGVTLGNLIKKGFFQGDIFGERERLYNIDRTCDVIKDRFGENAVMRGVSLTKGSIKNDK
ncbi:MAG: DNA polymerase IV [Clostridiales bacterium]|nr:DNA polymerase IV [Clostridiales bacterium]MCF8023619.1 DNA polymerase IV [Clostridiales bacterium]